MTFAAAYCRVSTEGQAGEDHSSLDIQERACRDYATTHGYTVLDRHVYREVYTGADLHGRPRYLDLRRALAAREVGVVIAYKVDRLSRDQIHIAVIVDDIERAGAQLEIVLEDFQRTPTGIFIMQARAFAAATEREGIILRTQGGRRARAERGLPHFGRHAPYGYLINAARTGYEIDPTKVDTVRLIFDLSAAGATLREIARLLNEDAIPAPVGQTWRHSQVYGMLINPIYGGQAVGYRWRAGSKRTGPRRVRPAVEWTALPLAAPPIVTPEQCAAALDRLARNKAASLRNTRDPERYLLGGGLAYCGHCGARMHGIGAGKTGPSYRCGHARRDREARREPCAERPQVSAARLDHEVWDVVGRRLGDPAALLTLGRPDAPTPTNQPEIDRLNRAIAQLSTEINNLTDRLANLPAENVEAAYEGLRRRNAARQRYREQLDTLVAVHQDERRGAARNLNLTAWLAREVEQLSTAPTSKRRELLHLLGLRVRVERVDRQIVWVLEQD